MWGKVFKQRFDDFTLGIGALLLLARFPAFYNLSGQKASDFVKKNYLTQSSVQENNGWNNSYGQCIVVWNERGALFQPRYNQNGHRDRQSHLHMRLKKST